MTKPLMTEAERDQIAEYLLYKLGQAEAAIQKGKQAIGLDKTDWGVKQVTHWQNVKTAVEWLHAGLYRRGAKAQ